MVIQIFTFNANSNSTVLNNRILCIFHIHRHQYALVSILLFTCQELRNCTCPIEIQKALSISKQNCSTLQIDNHNMLVTKTQPLLINKEL